jgi:DNA-binding response OmpR family regulator
MHTGHEVRLVLPEALPEALDHGTIVMVEWSNPNVSVIEAYGRGSGRHGYELWVLCPNDASCQVAAYALGADDVIYWPCDPFVLQSKLRARARRHAYPSPQPLRAVQEEMSVDYSSREIAVGGIVVALTPKEFGLFVLLAENGGTCVSRDHALDSIWGIEHDPETNIIDVVVCSLRRKLRRVEAGPRIDTVRGIGYRLAGNTSAVRLASVSA